MSRASLARSLTLKSYCVIYIFVMNTTQNTSSTTQAALYGLAAVGFITLVGGGMWLAVYSARFVPGAINRIGAAAVSLSEIFTPGPGSSLSVVPTASTTIPFGQAATSTTPTTTPSKPVTTTPVTPVAGQATSGTYPIGGTSTSTAPGLYGLADLTTSISAVGYLATTSANSFVVATTVPSGSRPAVKFVIKNIGTNATGSNWTFSASIPTQTAYIYQSLPQPNLNPGDSIEYTLGFDQANRGSQTISITANASHTVPESSTTNDSAAAPIVIMGS